MLFAAQNLFKRTILVWLMLAGTVFAAERPDPYRITVNHMQNDLFDETSSLWIELGGRRVSKPVLPNDGQLVFENVTVEPDECEMQIGIDGTFVKRKYRSNYDIGHRNIHVELMEGSTEREERQ